MCCGGSDSGLGAVMKVLLSVFVVICIFSH